MKKLGRNEPCPCGSGKKYKHCCWNKSFEWAVDEEGNVKKQIPINPELKKMYDREAEEFRKTHGRNRDANESIFREMGHPEHVEAWLVDKLKEVGVEPDLICL